MEIRVDVDVGVEVWTTLGMVYLNFDELEPLKMTWM